MAKEATVITKKPRLSLKQRLFCQHYVETLGNGTEAVIRAGYDVGQETGKPDRKLARSMASENLTKPDILTCINSLLEKAGLNDENVAVQHWFLINQSVDLGVKARGIDMYYKLKGKYSQQDPESAETTQALFAVVEHVRKILPSAGQ